MIGQAGHQVHFTIYPTPFHYHILILCLNSKLVNFNFKWIYMYIYIWTQTPSATPLQPNKMKCSFLDYVHLLMISQAGQWTRAPSATHLQPKKWNAHFWIAFNFWWLAGLVNGLESCPPPLSSQKNEMHFWIAFNFWWLAGLVNELEPHLPPLSSQKSEMLIFGLSSPFWWSARLVDGLKPHLPPISSQKSEMLIFGLHSTSDNRPGWSMDSNPIHHLSPAKNMKCSFLDYVQLLMIGWAGWWTWTLSTTPLQPEKWNAHFWITFTFWWLAGLVDGFEPHPPPISSQKSEMLIFGLHSTSDGWLG